MLDAGTSSIILYLIYNIYSIERGNFNMSINEIVYFFIQYKNYIWNKYKKVKITMTRGKSAVVKYLWKNTEATQRLNAEDLNYAYLVGIIEGDGWISVSKKGKYISYEVGIELSIEDIQLLYKIKNILGVGIIKTRKRITKTGKEIELGILCIRNKKHLKEIIIPIFDKYPMLTNKQYDYIRLKSNLLKNIIYSKDLLEYSRPIEPINTVEEILNTYYFSAWLIGFIEAEGCFSIYKVNKDNSMIASFEITQTNSENLIKAIKTYLKITQNISVDKTNNFKLKTTSIRGIQNIIKFINKNPIKLLGKKRLQYILFLKKLRLITKYRNKIIIPNKY